MRNTLSFAFALMLVSSALFSATPAIAFIHISSCSSRCITPSVGANVEVAGETTPDRQRVETTISVDPRDANVIVAGAQDLAIKATDGHRWHGFYRSTDAGKTWTASLLPGFPGDTSPEGQASPLKRWNATTDPTMAFDSKGNLYYAGGALTISGTTVTTSSPTLFVAKFTNDGATYSGVTVVSGSSDKQWLTVDTTGGQYDGRVYIVMDDSVGGSVVFTYSSDGGATFANSTPIGGRHGSITVAPDGTVYAVTWNNANLLQISKITNGGAAVATNISSIPITPLPSPLPGGSFRTGNNPGIASDSSGIYVTWGDYGSGSAQVMFSKSADTGSTWSTPIQVNDASTGQHFFPVIAVFNRVISIAWYDSRFSTGTTLMALDLYYSESIDAGASFSPNIRVTSVSFDPEAVERSDPPNQASPFIGDYIDISAGPSGVFPVWADNRNACDVFDVTYGCVDQDIFIAPITPAVEPSTSPNFSISASQTSITISQGESQMSTLTITSLNGFSGQLSSSLIESPTGITSSLNSSTLRLASNQSASTLLRVNSTPSTRLGSYIVNATFTGTMNGTIISHSLAFSVQVTGNGGAGCFFCGIVPVGWLSYWWILAVGSVLLASVYLVRRKRSAKLQ